MPPSRAPRGVRFCGPFGTENSYGLGDKDPWLPLLLRMDMLLGPPQLVATLHLREFRETGDASIPFRDICEGGRLGKHHIPQYLRRWAFREASHSAREPGFREKASQDIQSWREKKKKKKKKYEREKRERNEAIRDSRVKSSSVGVSGKRRGRRYRGRLIYLCL